MTADEIKSARHALGLSLTKMAEALGLNRRTVMRLESGELAVIDRTEKQVANLLELRARRAKEGQG